MVSVIAKTIRSRRQDRGKPLPWLDYSSLSRKDKYLNIPFFFSALCELFDKADTGGDGTISIPEYIAMCDEYGIAIDEDHINSIKAIANENGEVSTIQADIIKQKFSS